MARKVLEVSIFWAGELFAIKRFAANARVTLEGLGVPEADDVVVTAQLVDAGPRFARNRPDLPLVAAAVVAALLNVGTVASFIEAPRENVITAARGRGDLVLVSADTVDDPTPARVLSTSRADESRRCATVADYLRANHLTRMPPP